MYLDDNNKSIEITISKKSIVLLAFGIILVSAFLLYPRNTITGDISLTGNPGLGVNPTGDIRVEVIHFHSTNQCWSCKRLGELAEKTVDTYFSDELESGKLVFAHVNGELPENREFVTKYGATGSSLWIGTYTKERFEKEQNTAVWYKINDEAVFMEYLKGVIDNKLGGESG